MNPNHIPVMIVSGYLGSGKTTLINRLLRQSKGVRFALIVNELGEIGLDGHLLKGPKDFVKMDNGCLCCVLSEELVKTIGKLKARDDYDMVILETTGIADPLPIAWPFLRPEFADKFRFAGIITVVDACHFNLMRDQAAEVDLQIERADYVYMSKTDMVTNSAKTNVLAEVTTINQNARVVMQNEDNWFELLFGMIDSADKAGISKKNNVFAVPAAQHGFDVVVLDLTGQKICLDVIEDFFESLPKQVYRAKAVFTNLDDGQIYVLHAVCGRIDFYKLDEFDGQQAAVFIGKEINGQELKLSANLRLNIK